MCKLQQWLLVLFACFCPNTVFAQINASIEIKGVSAQLEENIRLSLSIEQQKNHALLSEGRLRRLHAKAPLEATKAIMPFGYYRAEIQSALILTAPDKWQAIYTIDPGPPLPVGEFNFVVNTELQQDEEFQKLSNKLVMRKGDAFSHIKYEDIKRSLSILAAERGYFKARFVKHLVEIDLAVYEARVHLTYDSGPRYHFGDVLLKQDVLAPEFLQRYIPFEKSNPYTLTELISLQQALNDSDYFSSVEVSPGKPLSDNNEVPISVVLTPRKRHRYSVGLGYGSDTGTRTKFAWDIPRLNKSGHRINTEARVSEIGYSFAVHYRIPILNPRTDQLVYSAGVINEKTDTSDSTVRTVGASLNRSHGAWRESIALNYQQEEFVIASDHGVSDLLMPSINWSRTWGQNFIYTLDGLRFDISLRGASEKLLSDTDFFQFQGGLKGISSLGHRNRFIARGRLGSIRTDDFHQLPSSVRFFAGGAQSVRGYAYQSLGPLDASGRVIGGQHLMVGSIEFEHSFTDKWGVAVFYDAGNAIDNINEKLERGAGLGLRWQSPIGPVRVDLASAISRDGEPWRLHINIGPDL